MITDCFDIDNFRKFKVGGFVVFDYLVAILSSYAVSQFFSISLLLAFAIVIIITIATCYYCDINTYMNNYFGVCSASDTTASAATPATIDTSQTVTPTTTTLATQ